MRIITTLIAFVLLPYGNAQTASEVGGSSDLKKALDRSGKAIEEVKSLRSELREANKKNAQLSSALEGMQAKVSSEITRSQELQAQNERAMNLALDEFKKKFEEQNKTVEAVQSSLDEKFNKQLVFFVLGLVLFVIIALFTTRSATKKGLNQANANWNEFQEHLLRK
jgi:predicted RNase H-like nuclease (RuvC/YqgF family)